MAYADQEMSSNKIISIVLVVIIHLLLGYALVTGLAYTAVKKVATQLDMIDIEEEEPPEEPEEPPPPPPDQPIEPPPVVSPPPIVAPVVAPRPVIRTVPTAPPPPAPVVAAPPAPPPPPPPQRANPEPRGNPGNWANANDYPSRALREEREGTTRFRLTVGANGRVTDCQITGSSGHADLDQAACKNLTRRARFRPSLDANGEPTTGYYANAVRWQIPE
ncbi:energy transducer TonB [Sphingorhabdus sp. 109]|jgi:protein TonB|uniref:energy transducer TonB n=1 Tax=Sphingorhabdus sp. 109 TaxID=2653173 RepID=UPI0012EF25D5|nr:energy transducer TonB [Sphingorhabdus sp. 109]VWX59714.1 Energy transducer TonB [Sphingorhabdus sp. 109]